MKAVLIRALSKVFTDKKTWKIIGAFTIGFFLIIALFFSTFISMITGFFGMFTFNNPQKSWDKIKNNVSKSIDKLNESKQDDVKDTIYEFMPNLNFELKKNSLAQKYENHSLIFDTQTMNKINSFISDVRLSLYREQNDEFYSLLSNNNITGFNYEDLYENYAFRFNSRLINVDEYTDNTRNFINAVIDNNKTTIDYKTEKINDQTTYTIKTENKILKVIFDGNNEINVPQFLAMYQTRVLYDTMNSVNSDNADEINSDIEEVLSYADKEDLDAADDDLWKGIQGEQSDSFNIKTFNTSALTKIIGSSELNYNLKTEKSTDQGIEILTITVKSPTTEEWFEIFGITEEKKSTYENNLSTIKQTLSEANIRSDQQTIKTSSLIDESFFSEFQGILNSPVNSSYIKDITSFGEIDDIHQKSISGIKSYTWEEGLTYKLTSTTTPVYAKLTDQSYIEDVIVTDAWDMDNHDIILDEPSYTYNRCAVQLAIIINVRDFKKTYGYDFPKIYDVNGDELKPSSNKITFLIEYNGLKSLAQINETHIGKSVKQLMSKGITIGYANDGSIDKTKDDMEHSPLHYRYYQNKSFPSLTVQAAFTNKNVTKFNKPENYSYKGLSSVEKTTRVNPLLWISNY